MDTDQINFSWTSTIRGVKFRGRIREGLFNRQIINHFENHNEISSKMKLFQNTVETCEKNGLNVFNFMPLTFVFNLDDLSFFKDIGHFFRYFKGLDMFNLLRTRRDLNGKPDQIYEEKEEIVTKVKSKTGSDQELLIKENLECMEKEKPKSKEPKNLSEELSTGKEETQEEMYVLQNLYNKIVREIIKNPTTKLTPRKTIYKKLLKILNNPAHRENDGLEKILNKDLDMKVNRESNKKTKRPARRKGTYGTFQKNLFNEEKRTFEIPGKNSFYNKYYLTHLAPSFNLGRNLWLLKVSQYNRGFGIELFHDLATFVKHLVNFRDGYEENLQQVSKSTRNYFYLWVVEYKKISSNLIVN